MSETKTLHFTIGENFGIRLMQIANEHCMYEYDIDKAFKVFNDSFYGGCPINLQKALVTGDMVIEIDEESQEMLVCPREPKHDGIFPKIDFEEYFKNHSRRIREHSFSLIKSLKLLRGEIGRSRNYNFKFSNEAIIKYIYGDDSEVLRELQWDDDLQIYTRVIAVTKDFIEKSLKIGKLCERVNYLYGTDYFIDPTQLVSLNKAVIDLADYNFVDLEEEDEKLSEYLENSKEISKVFEVGIKPVDIMQKWNAGWLAPNGDYYALNGDIANMLHVNIAEALLEAEIIPNDEDNKVNPSVWLEENGWVKIHNNWILYDACNNKRKNLPNKFMTSKQLKLIHKYIDGCHGNVMKVGFSQTRLTPTMFLMEERNDKRKFYEDYFTY